MKAIRALAGKPVFEEVPEPAGDGVLVRVMSAGICGSDLHMLPRGFLDGKVIGHEFAGLTADGTAVAVEPTIGCGQCQPCGEGYNGHCEAGLHIMGVMSDGGMAEQVVVPARNLVALPSGLEPRIAALVEPLAVAIHGLDRARVIEGDRVLVIGAGPIGLATAAALQWRQFDFDILARHPHQQLAAEALGGRIGCDGHYDVVIDAVGTSESLGQAVQVVRPLGRIGLVGSLWDPAMLAADFCMKEVELIAATTYNCKSPQRNFEEAGRLLAARPGVATRMVTHRFPLDAVTEAFAAAADRSAGAIKVVFEL